MNLATSFVLGEGWVRWVEKDVCGRKEVGRGRERNVGGSGRGEEGWGKVKKDVWVKWGELKGEKEKGMLVRCFVRVGKIGRIGLKGKEKGGYEIGRYNGEVCEKKSKGRNEKCERGDKVEVVNVRSERNRRSGGQGVVRTACSKGIGRERKGSHLF